MTTHRSIPNGREFLAALADAGGALTGIGFYARTKRLGPNNGACDARRILDDFGIEGALDLHAPTGAIVAFWGTSGTGKRTCTYRLRRGLMPVVRAILAGERVGLEAAHA